MNLDMMAKKYGFDSVEEFKEKNGSLKVTGESISSNEVPSGYVINITDANGKDHAVVQTTKDLAHNRQMQGSRMVTNHLNKIGTGFSDDIWLPGSQMSVQVRNDVLSGGSAGQIIKVNSPSGKEEENVYYITNKESVYNIMKDNSETLTSFKMLDSNGQELPDGSDLDKANYFIIESTDGKQYQVEYDPNKLNQLYKKEDLAADKYTYKKK